MVLGLGLGIGLRVCVRAKVARVLGLLTVLGSGFSALELELGIQLGLRLGL